MKNILIIDDEVEMLNSLEKILSYESEFDLTLIQDGIKAKELVTQKEYDLILSDLKMNKVSGIDILKTVQDNFPMTPVILISGYGTIEASVEAMQNGAFDFIEKPFSSKKLIGCISRAFEQSESNSDDENLTKKFDELLPEIIYESNQMAGVIESVKKIAAQNMMVLLLGESGSGKEVIARAIHKLSKGNHNPFVPINCGALPENLFESELFGHERGAFTGAVKTKPGLLEFANNGTFFFDEIGDMSLALQVKLLRLLEDRKIRRVGGNKEIDINVRIIAASNKDLEKAISEGKFREDLYYRLNTFPITIPSLRERKEDIKLLANHFLADLCMKNDGIMKSFSSKAENAIRDYSWPGNVRELQNVVGRAYFLCPTQNKVIQKEDLMIFLCGEKSRYDSKILNQSYKDAKESIIEKFEVEYLTHHLKENNGNISLTASKCGIDRRSIHRLISKYNIIYSDE